MQSNKLKLKMSISSSKTKNCDLSIVGKQLNTLQNS